MSVHVLICLVSVRVLVCLYVCLYICVYVVGMTIMPAVTLLTTLRATMLTGQTVMLGHSLGNTELAIPLQCRHSVLPQIGLYCFIVSLIIDA